MPGKYSVRNDTLCPASGAARGMMIAAALVALFFAASAHSDTSSTTTNVVAKSTTAANDFPTLARVEYVQECINRTGGDRNHMYQCSCVVDRIAEAMSYDEFVESSTYARYSTLPGEGGGIFRDTDEAKAKAKRFRGVEEQAFLACNLKRPG
jgi:hypothetical protein